MLELLFSGVFWLIYLSSVLLGALMIFILLNYDNSGKYK